MSGLSAWQMPAELPEGTQSRGPGLVQISGDVTAGVVPKTFTKPLVRAETERWTRPSGSASFPLHPLGSLELYRRALELLRETDLAALLRSEAAQEFEAAVWRAVLGLFRPGVPIRARIDQAIEQQTRLAVVSQERAPTAVQLSASAAWLVLTAAVIWASEASA